MSEVHGKRKKTILELGNSKRGRVRIVGLITEALKDTSPEEALHILANIVGQVAASIAAGNPANLDHRLNHAGRVAGQAGLRYMIHKDEERRKR